MKILFGLPDIKQFVSYFFVGGIAAVVEWIMFFFFANVLYMHYIFATSLAFIFSTTTNWLLGRMWTFKKNKKYNNKKGKEVIVVFVVSGIGLFFNIILMYIFVSFLCLNTDALKSLSKVMATGIVFIWNFLIRKFIIYKE